MLLLCKVFWYSKKSALGQGWSFPSIDQETFTCFSEDIELMCYECNLDCLFPKFSDIIQPDVKESSSKVQCKQHCCEAIEFTLHWGSRDLFDRHYFMRSKQGSWVSDWVEHNGYGWMGGMRDLSCIRDILPNSSCWGKISDFSYFMLQDLPTV